MDDHEYAKVFQPIAEGIRNNKDRQKLTPNCEEVLDKKIRPVIKQAEKNVNVRGEYIEFNSRDERPYIRIQTDEIQFICRGDTVEIVTKIDSGSSNSGPIHVQTISEEEVLDRIATFFRRVYNLPAVALEDQ